MSEAADRIKELLNRGADLTRADYGAVKDLMAYVSDDELPKVVKLIHRTITPLFMDGTIDFDVKG